MQAVRGRLPSFAVKQHASFFEYLLLILCPPRFPDGARFPQTLLTGGRPVPPNRAPFSWECAIPTAADAKQKPSARHLSIEATSFAAWRS